MGENASAAASASGSDPVFVAVFTAGLAAHGLGTARAFHVDPLAGTFAGISTGLNALLTAILVPLLLYSAMGPLHLLRLVSQSKA